MDTPKKSTVEKIFIHCSDSEFGHAFMIDKWHKARGWKMCGYNEIILNGYPTADWKSHDKKVPHLEGSVEVGRAIDTDSFFDGSEIPAHVLGENSISYGICMIGKNDFSDVVLNKTLEVTKYRLQQFNLKPKDVYGHYEADPSKTCPNINMNRFRANLVTGTKYGELQKPLVEMEDVRKELPLGDLFVRIFKKIFKR